MTPLGLIVTLSLALLVLSHSRYTAALALIAAVCYITEAQVLNVGFHFTAIRLVLLAALIRVLARGESKHLRLNAIDKSLIVFSSASMIISVLRIGTLEEFVYRLGCLYDVMLSYFVFRCLLRGEEDCRKVLAKLPLVIVPFALLMVLESMTDRNVFAGFGGVLESSWIRDGHVRSQGPFRNPITAGAFGATFAMLYASILFSGTRSRSAVVGMIASILIVVSARSSGPFLGLALGFLALACWPLRRQTRAIRWGIVGVLVGLQLFMKAPIWFLIGRISDLVGGGGYHRAYLIDQAVKHFSAWWLAGTSDTSDWFPYQLPGYGTADITNMFVAAGVDAGVVGVILSIVVIVRCFQRLGRKTNIHLGSDRSAQRWRWGLGATLVASLGILFSVTYMDQMHVVWYYLLASIAAVNVQRKRREVFPGQESRRETPYVPEHAGSVGATNKIDEPHPEMA
jgi:hypothetical protein